MQLCACVGIKLFSASMCVHSSFHWASKIITNTTETAKLKTTKRVAPRWDKKEENLQRCLVPDCSMERNTNVRSTGSLFLIIDHMFKNRKILSEAQKIGNNLIMGLAFFVISPVFVMIEESSHRGIKKPSEIRNYPMVALPLLSPLVCEYR